MALSEVLLALLNLPKTVAPYSEIPKILNGVGISIYSTTKGILSDRECRRQKVGGEILCTVW